MLQSILPENYVSRSQHYKFLDRLKNFSEICQSSGLREGIMFNMLNDINIVTFSHKLLLLIRNYI